MFVSFPTAEESRQIHSQEEPHIPESSLPSVPAHPFVDQPCNGQTLPQTQGSGCTTQPSRNNESSPNQADPVDNAIAIHGAPDATLPDSQRYPGFKEATLETHWIDGSRGLVNKRTGQAHMQTVLRTANQFVIMSFPLSKATELTDQFITERATSSYTGVVFTLLQLHPWDTQGNIMRVPRRIPSNCAPDVSKDDVSCALCGDKSHRLEDCVGPPNRFKGAILGCPACNTLMHSFDDCPQVKGTTGKAPMSLERKFELIVVKRQDKPMFLCDPGFTPEDYANLLPRYPIRAMPWSPSFTRDQFDKGGPWLQYNYQTATPELPRDPWGERTLQALRSGRVPEIWPGYA
ncbi:hypothetical protein PFICI_00922 [Pestalotiopsis fici W106-1]|uniref:CCHC-type domain-containing protein n=1 Tax=Pestalotiopsis fici (strain W106-1 / CGMCC3.15140) TaxID=1229662 RepID=W3XM74_PESFW|nr:uncharacterized protein PFICI_00922 [Pestalotiopsis fici W106-1]ETS87094.1 hypothetical protein PFICI_00922 [Pestalotiopsis fici W106-1]